MRHYLATFPLYPLIPLQYIPSSLGFLPPFYCVFLAGSKGTAVHPWEAKT